MASERQKVYVVMYGIGWPEDGEDVAGVYSTRELAERAAAKDKRPNSVTEMDLDADPQYMSDSD